MNSLIIEISEKVRGVVCDLDKSIDSSEGSDKIAEIDKTIEVIKELVKPLNSGNSGKLLGLFPQVVDCLEDAKSALESEETGDYKKLIWNAYELSHLIEVEVKSKNRISK